MAKGTTPVSRHLNRWVSYHPPKIKKDAQTFFKSVRPSQYAAMRQRFFFTGQGTQMFEKNVFLPSEAEFSEQGAPRYGTIHVG